MGKIVGIPKGGQTGQVDQKDVEKERQTLRTAATRRLFQSTLTTCRAASLAVSSRVQAKNKLWVGWGSNPQPTP